MGHFRPPAFSRQTGRTHLRAVTEFAGKTGPAWVEEFEPEMSKLPAGTVVAINCVTGEYVTGKGLFGRERRL